MTLSNPITPSLWHDCDSLYMAHQTLFLQLQDDHQLNVNLLLLTLWLDKHHYSLAKPQWQTLQQATLTWEQKLLIPYRQLRRQSKALLETEEYQQMLKLELMLERKSQVMILKTLQSMSVKAGTNTNNANLSQYLALFDLDSRDFPSLQIS
ncbi:TIGR02444 family protein [Shewanella sp. Isolate13]|uniref:TIGR02444 family protein n=1 Tax=Shewanella sp. Isolate13 TaxID=2908531 RepID=UPI001EFD75B2|nr:TIGR02444 family protein [Shewanella sp. Isolate13]MCG9728633.1 TIGR02444 family protein [Shewanella sp. Isolate13]